MTPAPGYETFFVRNLRIFAVSVFSLTSLSRLVCLQVSPETTQVSTFQVLQSKIGSWPYRQTLD
jgi:hypothetical protein